MITDPQNHPQVPFREDSSRSRDSHPCAGPAYKAGPTLPLSSVESGLNTSPPHCYHGLLPSSQCVSTALWTGSFLHDVCVWCPSQTCPSAAQGVFCFFPVVMVIPLKLTLPASPSMFCICVQTISLTVFIAVLYLLFFNPCNHKYFSHHPVCTPYKYLTVLSFIHLWDVILHIFNMHQFSHRRDPLTLFTMSPSSSTGPGSQG